MKTKTISKILAVLLCVLMVVAVFPFSALAAENTLPIKIVNTTSLNAKKQTAKTDASAADTSSSLEKSVDEPALSLNALTAKVSSSVAASEVVSTPTGVAKVGNTEYATIDEAIEAAVVGDTITVLADIDALKATINKNITVDLGGKTITDAYIIVKAEVTVQNGSIKNTNESYPLVVQNGGKLTIENVAIEASKSDRAIWVRSGSSLIFNGGSVLATKGENNTKTSLIAAIYTDTNTDVTINGGTITVDTPDNKAIGIYGNYSDANVTVNDGKISTSGKNYSYGINVDGDITVTGGEIVTNEKGYGYSNGIRYGNNYALVTAVGDVEISGGSITTNGYSGYIVSVGRSYSSNDQTITISGGTFANDLSEVETTTGGHKAPVLIWEGSASKVTATISNGEFEGFNENPLRGDNTTLEVSGGAFDVLQDSYIVTGATVTVAGETFIKTEEGNKAVAAKIGNTGYKTLEEAFAAAQEGETIVLLADATPALTSQRAITKAAVIDLNDKTLTLTEDDLYFGTTTFQNGEIVVDPSVKPSTAVFWMFANQTLTFDGVKLVATGVTGTYLIGLDGNNSDLNILNGSEILVENETALDLDIICVNASTGNDILVENSKVNVTNLDGRVFFRGNYTISGTSEIALDGITKAGFRIEAGQTLSIEDTASVTVAGELRDGGIHLTDLTAKYNKEETATVSATVNNSAAVASVGDTYYATIADAIAAAKNGDTVVILPGEYGPINISYKNITIQGTVGENGELLTTIKGGDPAIIGHYFNGTIKDLKIVDAWKAMYAEPAGNVTVDNVYVTGATFGFHLVAYSEGLTWTIQNSYMDLSWANSFGVYNNGDAAIVIKGNTFASTNPYYPDYGALPVNSYLPNVTVEQNVFGENTKVYIDKSVTDTSKINISKNYHADGVDNAFANDAEGITLMILAYYTDAELTNLVTRVAQIGDTYYATLADALAEAQAGDEVILLDDVTEDVTVPAGVILNGNGKQVGVITAAGTITFKGHIKATNFNTKYTNTTINIGEGACLEITGADRLVIGHGCTFNITGTIADAKTANVADLTPSLIFPGASFTGAGVTFNVTNAYVKFTAYCSSKNSNASSTFTFNVTNSVWEQSGSLVFSEPTNGMDPTFNFYLTDSVLNSTSHLVFAVAKGEIVFDNSNVNVGVYRQLENRSTLTIKNGSVVYSSVQTSSNAKNPGTTIVDNATYVATGDFSGSDVGTGTLIIKKGASVTMGKITRANIVVDATDMTAGDVIDLTANLSALTGTVSVVNNGSLEANIVDGKIVLSAKRVAQIGDITYATLEEAFKAATAGCVIEILSDVVIDYYWDARYTGAKFTVPVTIKGNGHTLTFTNTVYDAGNNMSVFRFEADATVQNLTIDMSQALSGWGTRLRAISAKANLTVDNCAFIGNGSDNITRAIIFGEGGTAESLANVVITVTGSEFIGWRQAISDNESGKTEVNTIVITGNTMTDAGVNVSASNSITFNDNVVEGKFVKLVTYAADNTLTVTATGNTLTANGEGNNQNYTNAKNANVQDGFVRPPRGEVAYRGYINDSTDREGIQIDLTDVYALNSFVIKLYDAEGNLLTTTTLKQGGVDAASYTCNIVLWGSASGSWDTVIHAEKLTVANIPTTAEIYADGVLVDTYENLLGVGTNVNELPKYLALDCVYKEAKIGDTYYASFADALAAAKAGETITLLTDVTVTEKINLTNVNIDLNEKTLYLKTTGNYVVDTVTISNGTIDVTGNTVNGNTFFTVGGQWAKAGSVLNLDDVNLIGDGYHTDWAVICVHNGTSLNMTGCTVDLKNDNGTTGGFIKDTSGNNHTAIITITDSTLTLENVDRGFTGAKVTLDNVELTITGGEHGINGAELTVKDSTISISDGIGRGITLTQFDASIVNSTVTISNMGEGGIRFKTANALTVDAASTLAATTAHADVEGATLNGQAVTGTEDDMSTVTVENGTTTVVNPVYVAMIGTAKYKTLADAIKAAQANDTITLLDDVVLTESLVIDVAKTLTIDGNGFSIKQAEGYTDTQNGLIMLGSTLYGDAEAATHNYTLKNIVFDGVSNWSVIRAQGVTLTVDGCTVKDSNQTNGQALFRLDYTEATIQNTKFVGNNCLMCITHNFNGDASTSKLTINECVFETNTANKTAAIYYVTGSSCIITNSEFIGNDVNCNENGAVIYLGFTENNVVTGNLFSGNKVVDASTSTRVAGAIFFGYEAEISGNAFINNTASNANGDVLGQICTSTYYDCTIDLSGNYWGGEAPVYGKDYTVQHQTGEADFALDSYYTAYTTDANGNVVLEDTNKVSLTYVAMVGKFGYTTIADAIKAANVGDTVTILAGEYSTNIDVNKAITVIGETDADGNNLVNISGKLNVTADGATVKNLNVNNGSSTAGCVEAKNVLIEGCTVVGGNGFRYCYTDGTVTFKDSTITGSTYGIHFDGNAGGNIVIDNCVITGWTSFASTIETVTIKNTTFEEGNYNKLRFYQNAEIINCTFNENMSVDFGQNNVSADFVGCTVENGGSLLDVIYLPDIAEMGIEVTVDEEQIILVASINGNYYQTLAGALAAVKEGETIQLLAGTLEEGTIKLPATLKDVTFKGAEDHTTILKDMTIMAADGNSISYDGITFDGIVFENSRITITGWRNNGASVKNLTVNNCVFKNLNDTTSSAPVHINMAATEAVENFTFTNNVIDGAAGGQKSGVYAQVTGVTVFTNNVINNVSFRPYVIQLTTDDGVADELIVTGNTFSGSAVGRAQALTNNAAGTDSVKLVVSENIFTGITGSQQICYWNFNSETTTVDLSNNYFDIDVEANPNKIYFNSACQNNNDLIAAGLTSYYKELNEDGTINTESAVVIQTLNVTVTDAEGNVTYYATLQAAVNAAQAGDTVTLLDNVALTEALTVPAGATVTLDLNGMVLSMEDASGATVAAIKNNGNLTIKDSSEAKTGKITFNSTTPSASNTYASNAISNYGTITIVSGTIENTTVGSACYALDNYAGSTATIEGGKLVAEKIAVRVFSWTNGESAKVTLNMTGGEIVSEDGYAINFNLGNAPAVELNISGGTITTNDEDYVLAVYVYTQGTAENLTVNVTGGTFNGAFAFNGAAVTTMKEGAISISGGTFDEVICYADPAYGFISGGTFKAPVAEEYCAKGYIPADLGDGTYGVKVGTYVAEVNGVKFENLQDAIDAAEAGETVTLLDSFTLDAVVSIERAIVLDLNEKTLTGADGAIVFNVKAATTIKNGTIKGNKSGTSSGLIDIYADLILDGVTIETSKMIALRFKVGEMTATLTDCNVTGQFKGFGGSVWVIKSGTYKVSSTAISDQLNGTASVSGGTFYYEIDAVDCAPGYAVVANDDGTYTVTYAPACFVDTNNNGVLDEGEVVYGSLEAVFELYQEGDVYIVLLGNVVVSEQVDTDVDAKYYLNTNVAEGVTVEFAYADDWNYVQNMYIGENVTLKAPYLLFWADVDIAGTVITDYLYMTGATVDVLETGVVTVISRDATIQVKNGTTFTVSGKVDTAILNVWAGESQLIVSGENAELNASWIDVWDGTPSVTVENGATLDVDNIKASRGGSITVDNATLDATTIELGHNGESAGVLTEKGDSTINGNIQMTAVGSTITSDGGLTVSTNIPDHKVVYEDGQYKVVPMVYVAQVGEQKFESLQDAIDAANGVTVELLAPITIAKNEVVTIDLKGQTVVYNSTIQGENMITNYGELTINDSSEAKTGVINYNYTGAADSSYSKGNNTISNSGKLTVNGGKITIANLRAHAKYPIDNNSTNGDAILVINGGHLYNYNTSAIRQFCNSTTYTNSVTINGGLIEGYCAIWVQNPGSTTVNGTLTITGGEIKTTAAAYVNGTSELKDVASSIYFTIGNGGAWSADSALSITGGTFNENVDLSFNAPVSITVDTEVAIFNGYLKLPVVYVAQIGEQKFESLQDAIDAAANGDTIILITDIAISKTITVPYSKSIIIDGNGKTISPAADFAADGNSAALVLANVALNYAEGRNYTVKNLTFKGFNGLTRVVRANFCDAVIDNCTFVENTVSNSGAGVITSAYAKLTVTNSVFDQNNSAFAIVNLGFDVSDGTELKAVFSGNSFTANKAAVAVMYLASSADVTGNYFAANVHTGTNDNAAAVLAGPYTGNMSYTINVNENAFDNAMGDKPAVFVEDWSSYGSTTSFDLSDNYWNGGKANYGYSGAPVLTLDSYYASCVVAEDGTFTLSEKIAIVYVAQIGEQKFETLADAFAAAQNGDTITLIADSALDEMIVNTKEIILDLNGKTITGTDTTSKNFSLIDNTGTLTINDSSAEKTGKITLTSTVNSGWNRYSAVIANNPGGKLTVNGGTFEHLGGTDMAYGIDSLTNGGNGDVSVTVNGGTIKSTYRAIRQFLNSDSKQNTLIINGGTIEGVDKSIFFHDPNVKANNGVLTVGADAVIKGDIYLFVTEGSTEWPVTVSIAAAALVEGSTVTSKNVPAGYEVLNSNGTWGVFTKYYITEYNLTINHDLSMGIIVELGEDFNIEDLFLRVQLENWEKIALLNNYKTVDAEKGIYIFYFNDITPQRLNDKITLELVVAANEEEAASADARVLDFISGITIREYCESLLGVYAQAQYDEVATVKEMRTLLVDLLNYGAAAQTIMGYQTDNLANNGLKSLVVLDDMFQPTNVTVNATKWASENVDLKADEHNKLSIEINEDLETVSVEWLTIMLQLEETINMRMVFIYGEADVDNTENLKVLVNGETNEKAEIRRIKGNQYYVNFTGFYAYEMDTVFKFEIVNAETNEYLSDMLFCSVASYSYHFYDSANEAERAMLQAMMNYGKAVEEYAIATGEIPSDSTVTEDDVSASATESAA